MVCADLYIYTYNIHTYITYLPTYIHTYIDPKVNCKAQVGTMHLREAFGSYRACMGPRFEGTVGLPFSQ